MFLIGTVEPIIVDIVRSPSPADAICQNGPMWMTVILTANTITLPYYSGGIIQWYRDLELQDVSEIRAA